MINNCLLLGRKRIVLHDMEAEIKDEGIDIDLPVDQNWIRKISGVNGSIIRTPSASLPAIAAALPPLDPPGT